MKRLPLLLIALLATASVCAATAPTQFYFRDSAPDKISLDETATGCRLQGVLLHPVAKPRARVIWFRERVCGQSTQPVSLVSDEISAPDNVIHKGQAFQAHPERVEIVQAGTL
ncbi:hypothetical protein [Pantoea agglomerans]|uniref:hypothetical protein n=1 Tax=Enterobacter agglomerans TaxID=549 RepID=UPI0032085187